MQLDVVFLGRSLDASPGGVALRIGHIFYLLKAGYGVAHMGGIVDGFFALFREGELFIGSFSSFRHALSRATLLPTDSSERPRLLRFSHTHAKLAMVFHKLIEKLHLRNGTRVALVRTMENVLEFPKMKFVAEDLDSPRPITTKKVFNIAEWTPHHSVTLTIPYVDTWPFFAA
jgi:hypothetical protein